MIISYNTTVTSYSKARRDFGRFWTKFSRAFPYCDCMCSIDQDINGSWYLNLMLFDKDSYDLVIPAERLMSFWGDGGCIETPLLEDNDGILHQLLSMLKSSLMDSPEGIIYEDEEEEEEVDEDEEVLS